MAVKGSGCSVLQGIAESDWKMEDQKPYRDGHDQNMCPKETGEYWHEQFGAILGYNLDILSLE